MKILKDTILKVKHSRKGQFFAMATKDFDTDKDEFYPIRLAQPNSVKGMNTEWEMLEEIPCRGSFCSVKIVKN